MRTIAIAASDLANVWTLLTAKMTKPRLYHTATRFESGPLAGQVLIVGGLDRADRAQGSSELYNPVTRTFVAAGNLPSKASGHTATLLLNGKVVVFGGGNSSVQAFDPATKTWSSAGSLSSNRSWHTATLLLDGRVLVIGGADNSGNTLASTIVYNPTTGTYANGPTLDTPREHHTATALPNGKVLVVGGRRKSGGSYVTHATYQICDATSCTASTGGIAARHSHAAVGLGLDGSKILVAGGANGSTDLATAEVYNTATGTWSTTGVGNLSLARRDLTLSELPNGRALAAGGSKSGYAEEESDVYGPPLAIDGADEGQARRAHGDAARGRGGQHHRHPGHRRRERRRRRRRRARQRGDLRHAVAGCSMGIAGRPRVSDHAGFFFARGVYRSRFAALQRKPASAVVMKRSLSNCDPHGGRATVDPRWMAAAAP